MTIERASTDCDEAIDQAGMALALAVGRRGLGSTAPNPAVGAIVVDPATGEVVARGWTQPGGRPHAETEALRRAGRRARGATLYVTLEPCSHHGRTPPCADAIVAAGIGRVVAGIVDPDPRVAGRGLTRLAEAGIAVRRHVLASACDWLTRGHILRVTERRPFVQLKLAVGADGDIAFGRDGRPTWVTGPQARAQGHRLRAEADAILVGIGTVLADDPELTCRLPGAGSRSPVRVVLDSRLRIPLDSRLVRSAGVVPVWIVCTVTADAERRQALAAAGCRVIEVQDLAGVPWLPAVMEELVASGTTRLLVEGGPRIWRAFAEAALADEVVAYAAVGPEHLPSVLDGALLRQVCHGLALVETRPVGHDMMLVFRRRARHLPASAGIAGLR